MAELPNAVIEAARRLTRLARRASDPSEAAAYRQDRDDRLAAHGFRARVRTEADPPVLVCYPDEWVTDGVVHPDRIDDLDRAVERPIDGRTSTGSWEEIEAHNRDLVDAFRDEHGPVHGATAAAFADFMGNHYARRIETAGERECREFLEDYLPRNAWPTDEQLDRALATLVRLYDHVDEPCPQWLEGKQAVDSDRLRDH